MSFEEELKHVEYSWLFVAPSPVFEQCHLDKKKIHLEQMCRNAYLFFFM